MIKKALCVDDDKITLMIVKKTIKRFSFAEEIATAQNGQQAIQLLKQIMAKPDAIIPEIILLDVNMPVMNGWDFLKEFEQNYLSYFSQTKVAIITSSVDPSDQSKAVKYKSVIGFYSKPISKGILENIKAKVSSATLS